MGSYLDFGGDGVKSRIRGGRVKRALSKGRVVCSRESICITFTVVKD